MRSRTLACIAAPSAAGGSDTAVCSAGLVTGLPSPLQLTRRSFVGRFVRSVDSRTEPFSLSIFSYFSSIIARTVIQILG